MTKIYIDPGHNHSGADAGAAGNGLREQDITYLIASRVEKILLAKGVTVKMSRNSLTANVTEGGTVNDSLRARYSEANNWGADLFVSVHCNAHTNTSAKGSEVYCYKSGTKSETLAKNILNGLIWNTDLISRGVKTANYAVIKHTNMPAVLVETGFITNSQDAKVLGAEDGQKQIAKGIAEGILEYLGVNYSSGFDDTENSNTENSTELITPNDIVWELAQRGLVSDKDGMIAEMEQNPNGRLYHLARKIVNRYE